MDPSDLDDEPACNEGIDSSLSVFLYAVQETVIQVHTAVRGMTYSDVFLPLQRRSEAAARSGLGG